MTEPKTNRGMGYIPDDDPLAQAIGRLHAELAALREAAQAAVDAWKAGALTSLMFEPIDNLRAVLASADSESREEAS